MSSVHNLDREVLAEMSLVDIVYSLLKEGTKEPRSFQDILDEAAALKKLSEEQKLEVMAKLYTEINIDGRFKGVGDNFWGLRSWYPVEQAEEIVITDLKKKAKKKKAIDDEFDDVDYDDIDLVDDDDDIDLDDTDLDDIDDTDLDDLDDDVEEIIDDDLEDLDEVEDIDDEFVEEDLDGDDL